MFYGVSTRNILLNDGINPDFRFTGTSNFIDFIHRTTRDSEIYFLTNRHKENAKTTATFRIKGKPELWDPVTGMILKSPIHKIVKDGTSIELSFEAFQSVFVVFQNIPEAEDQGNAKVFQSPNFTNMLTLANSWEVSFDPKWGGPAKTTFNTLQDWSKSDDPKIKYYSGKAVYSQIFDTPNLEKGAKLFLDLGVVKDIASVKLNGYELGTVWTAPWRVEITQQLKPSGNRLEIEVINQWPNRLIGDAALPESERSTNTNIVFKQTDPLMASGLLGPVVILRML
ncbi:MAG: hypothetical protein EOO42_23495 [Flavobacteriales bacterium]|nr:MAG: hypothetical protein EOO42_23495 [Flavobacteriales bacterium]